MPSLLQVDALWSRRHNRAMGEVLLIDITLRLLAIGQLLLIALVVARSPYPVGLRSAVVLLLLCIGAYLAAAASNGLIELGAFSLILDFAAWAVPFLLWIVAHLLFERPLSRFGAAAIAAAVIVCWAALLVIEQSSAWRAVPLQLERGLAFVLAGHAVFVALRDIGDDLSDIRRRFRVGFVLVVGLEAIAIVAGEAWGGQGTDASGFTLLQSGSTVIAILVFGALLLSVNPLLLTPFSQTVAASDGLTPSEHVLKQKLDAALAEGIYRAPGLTIGLLAERLGVPEHRLRSLINLRLGYRNFSAFVNTYRLADAKTWLADPERVNLPVLTLAMDLGYGSLAPFNRAFREATGRTPTDFRRAAILESKEI